MNLGLKSALDKWSFVNGGRWLSALKTRLGQSGCAMPARPTPIKSAPWLNASCTSPSSHMDPVVIRVSFSPNCLEKISVIGNCSFFYWVLFFMSQQDKCKMSISSFSNNLETSILSSIVTPQDGYSGDILTATTKSRGVASLILLTISMRNLDLFRSVPPHSSNLLVVFLPRNCVIR